MGRRIRPRVSVHGERADRGQVRRIRPTRAHEPSPQLSKVQRHPTASTRRAQAHEHSGGERDRARRQGPRQGGGTPDRLVSNHYEEHEP